MIFELRPNLPKFIECCPVSNEFRTNLVRKAFNPEILDYVFLTHEENLDLNLQQEYKFHKPCSCIIDGVYYNSFNKAAKDLGIDHKTVKNRILSDK